MPTPKIIVNGQEVAPIKKEKLPLSVDWQSVAAAKKEATKAPAKDKIEP